MLRIRPVTIDDAVAIWRAEVETAQVPGRLLSRPEELELQSFEAKIRALSESGGYVVALNDGEICGHAVLEPLHLASRRHVFSLTIVVHPGRTGQGIGSALLTHLQAWARSTPEVRKVELLVRATNVGARRLYERFGFVEEGRFRERVRLPTGDFVDDIAMAWFPDGHR
jgi:ribosomal protein S18 acetylase RimI-like enzyme